MINKNKLIQGVDDEVWRRYAGYCKAEGLKIGNHLSDLLADFLNNPKILKSIKNGENK